MSKFISNGFLYSLVGLFVLTLVVKFFISTKEYSKEQDHLAYQQSKTLSIYAMEHRDYYQALYIKGIIKLDSQTLQGLPAFSSSLISDEFSKKNVYGISIKTVSDRPRNEKNRADSHELEAIERFKNDTNAHEFFKKFDDFYQFAIPLKVEEKCLKCHGNKEDAPEFISQRYGNAYGYNLGDLRGILSVKIPTSLIKSHFEKLLVLDFAKNAVLLSGMFLFIFYLARKNRVFDDILKKEVKKKTNELKQSQEKLKYIIEHDEITKLPNNILLEEDIKNASYVKLSIINIDGFRNINDYYGTRYGDELLKEYAKYLSILLKDTDIKIYKMHSDEFALFCNCDDDKESYLDIVKSIIKKIDQKVFKILDEEVTVSSTIGICLGGNKIVSKANLALKKAKREKKDFVVYGLEGKQEELISLHLQISRMIKEAIANDNIIVYIQPICDTYTQKICKYEALVRMIDDKKNILAPFHFLEVSKVTKLYAQITKIVIEKALKIQLQNPQIPISINISSLDIENKTTLKYILQAIKNHPHQDMITFEILESDKIDNYLLVKSFIKLMKKYGCKFAIDDFGSGYSNFAHIIDLDIDIIKIDASLIKNIHNNKTSYEVVKAIREFTSSLDIEIVAEFVESKEILQKLQELGIEYSQGYYLGKPSPN